MNLANYKKAIGGFVGTAIPLLGAIAALNVLHGAAAHDVAVALAALTSISGPLGVVISPKNSPKTDTLIADVTDLLDKADRVRGAVAPAVREIISEADAQERQTAVSGVATTSDPSQYPPQGAPT